MKRIVAVVFALCLFALLLALIPEPNAILASRPADVQGPFFGEPVTPASFDGDLRSLPSITAEGEPPREIPLRHASGILPALLPIPQQPLQAQLPGQAIPSPLLDFDGLGYDSSCSGGRCGAGRPPDPNGDVGLVHYVEAVNTSFAVFDKTNGAQILAITFNEFWKLASGPTGQCGANNQGDPIVLYDSLSDRWVIGDLGFGRVGSIPVGPYYECIAVSKTGDPVAGGWWFYAFLVHNSKLNDYPKLGLWPDAYYVTYNMFGPNFEGSKVGALDRAKMIAGQTVTPTYFQTSDQYISLLPSNLHGAAPLAGSPELFLSIDAPNSTNKLHLWRYHFDPGNPINSWFGADATHSNPIDIPVNQFVEPCMSGQITGCIAQPGSNKGNADYLDSIGDRLMMQLQYRNLGGTESLWAAHTVATNGYKGTQTGVRWYEIRDPHGTPFVRQQSTFKPADGISRWLPSLAVDQSGNMAIGYSASSATVYPSIRYAGRLATDPINQLTLGEGILINGASSQKGGSSRWGDYSAMTVDPVDDRTFWYVNEYYGITGSNWMTRIGSFRLPVPIDDPQPAVSYDTWLGVVDAAAGGGSYRQSETTNDSTVFRFSGTSVKWNYLSGPDGGKAQVLIDGVSKGTVDLYSPTPLFAFKQYSGLAAASHTITIKVLGAPNGLLTGNKVTVDSFSVGTSITQDSSYAVRYNSWIGVKSLNAKGGTFRYSQTLNATATIQFTGSGISWIGLTGPGYGKARVILDSNDKGVFDLYSASTRFKRTLASLTGLTSGPHTLQIQVLHTRNAASTGFKVAIDGFDVIP